MNNLRRRFTDIIKKPNPFEDVDLGVQYQTPYGYFWNGIDITYDIMNNIQPDFINFRFGEIYVSRRRYRGN